jgi:hypothetical protein
MRLYVSGPMTGIDDLNFPAFNTAAAHLRQAGFEVVNPAEINVDPEKGWEQCLRADIKALMDCDGVALLPGWAKSRGAMLEIHNAAALRMQVHTVDEWLRAVPSKTASLATAEAARA